MNVWKTGTPEKNDLYLVTTLEYANVNLNGNPSSWYKTLNISAFDGEWEHPRVLAWTELPDVY